MTKLWCSVLALLSLVGCGGGDPPPGEPSLRVQADGPVAVRKIEVYLYNLPEEQDYTYLVEVLEGENPNKLKTVASESTFRARDDSATSLDNVVVKLPKELSLGRLKQLKLTVRRVELPQALRGMSFRERPLQPYASLPQGELLRLVTAPLDARSFSTTPELSQGEVTRGRYKFPATTLVAEPAPPYGDGKDTGTDR
jgi:hypothetical protein